jgi:hypothetical protein
MKMAVYANLMNQGSLFWPKNDFVNILGMSKLMEIHNKVAKTSLSQLKGLRMCDIRRVKRPAELSHLVEHQLTLSIFHNFWHWWVQIDKPFTAEFFELQKLCKLYGDHRDMIIMKKEFFQVLEKSDSKRHLLNFIVIHN